MGDIARQDLFDREDPRSLYNLLPEPILRRVTAVPTDLLLKTDEELAEMMPHGRFNVLDYRLRQTFWKEYERAAANLVPMNMHNVVAGVVNRSYFTARYMNDAVRVAFMLTPPTDYRVALEETLTTLVDKLRQVADLPVHGEDGKPLYKNIDLILKAFPHVDNRVKGGVTQRLETKSLTVSVQAEQSAPESVDEIDLKLKELEQKVTAGPKASEIKGGSIGAITVPFRVETDEKKDD